MTLRYICRELKSRTIQRPIDGLYMIPDSLHYIYYIHQYTISIYIGLHIHLLNTIVYYCSVAYVITHTYRNICIRIHKCMHTYTLMHIDTNTYTSSHTQTLTNTHTHICTHTHIHTYPYVGTYLDNIKFNCLLKYNLNIIWATCLGPVGNGYCDLLHCNTRH